MYVCVCLYSFEVHWKDIKTMISPAVVSTLSARLQSSNAHFLPKKLVDLQILKYELLWWLNSKESACNAGDPGLVPGSGRFPEKTATHSSIVAWEIP